MKHIFFPAILYAIIVSGCSRHDCKSVYKLYVPVFKSLFEVRGKMRSLDPQPLQNTGKIYVYGDFIFLNEPDKGIHVIDNSNPPRPKNISFIPIPGNLDIAVKGNYLYADSYSELVVFDISNPRNIHPKNFLANVFPYRNIYYSVTANSPDSVQVLVDFIEKDTIMDCPENRYGRLAIDPAIFTADAAYTSVPQSFSSQGEGIGGSMARFAILYDYLYTVSNADLSSFDISNPVEPQLKNTTYLNWNIETIYPFKNKLFIGSQNGMYIYDVSNAETPLPLGQFSHASSCDPVIADDNNAFVTLRSGTQCQGFTNQLEVLDIANLANPALLKVYEMTNPHGLSKSGNWLFICDGTDGLKMYDASDINNITLKNNIEGIETYDVITINNIALVVAKDGLYQYDFSDVDNIKLLSKIDIQNGG